ncbi:hypothetical protein ACHAQJ_003761 [Trichoderma viride]
MSLLHPEDKKVLLNEGLLRISNIPGIQRIHKRRLNTHSDVEYAHLPLSAPESNMFCPIPINLISLQTIKYFGYNEKTATDIWNEWANWVPEHPAEYDQVFEMPFLESVIGYLTKACHLDTSDKDDRYWSYCMNFCGINQETQTAILDPAFREARLARSCIFWIQDTIELRFRVLRGVKRASLERANAIQKTSS